MARKYTFDGFEIDPANRVLLRDGNPVHLTGKAFDVLVQLVENPGKLLRKDDLVNKVWAESFVEEGSVARTISNLRKVLADEGRNHKYIVTVPRHGYRFVADVGQRKNGNHPDNGTGPTLEQSAVTTGSAQAPAAENDGERGSVTDLKAHIHARPPLYVFWTLLVFVIIVTGLVISQLGFRAGSANRLYSFENARLTRLTQTGDVYAPRISPDGHYLAYNSLDRSLSVRHIASGSVVKLLRYPEGTAIWSLEIAPDNSFLYYVLKDANSEDGKLYRVPLLGGVPFKVADSAKGGVAISPAGNQIVFVRADAAERRLSLIVVDSDGTHERAIHSVTIDDAYHAIDWAPDGNSLGVSIKRSDRGGYAWNMSEIRLDNGAEIRVDERSGLRVIGLEWLPDKTGLIVNGFEDGSAKPQIYQVSYPDGVRRRVTNDLDFYQGISLTADGRNLVSMQQEIGRQIWTTTYTAGGIPSLLTEAALTRVDSVGWIGDESLAYCQDQDGSGGNYKIWRMRSDGTEKQQITFGHGNDYELTVSPDNRFIAFVSNRSGKDEIWRINADGTGLVQMTDIEHNVTLPNFSADSTKVYFLAWVEDAFRLWQVSADSGEATPVMNDKIYYHWALSPDGKRLAYLTFDIEAQRRRTHIFSLESMRIEQELDIVPETWIAWANDGRKLYFNSAEDGAVNIWKVGLNGGKPERATTFTDQRVFRFAISPHSNDLAIVRESTTYDAIMLAPHLY